MMEKVTYVLFFFFSCGCIMHLTLGGAPRPRDSEYGREAEGQADPSRDEENEAEDETETRNMTGAI